MKETQILNYYLIAEGFSNIHIEKIKNFFEKINEKVKDSFIQFFDANLVAGFSHLLFSVLNALKAYEVGNNISNNLSLEILLYASGQHQIKKALDLLGIKKDSSEIVVLVLADSKLKALKTLNFVSNLLGGNVCDSVMEIGDEKADYIQNIFGITNLEIEASLRKTKSETISNLLIERAAILAVKH
jgi:KEOPS complex subunit Cgi121